LQTATRNPAQFVNRLDTLGTIERGKIADLVLLDADPLQQIGNTRKISAVIVAGKMLSQAQRQELLAKIEAFAKQH
jgi:imidazolonepropionase-like amidohydrolase